MTKFNLLYSIGLISVWLIVIMLCEVNGKSQESKHATASKYYSTVTDKQMMPVIYNPDSSVYYPVLFVKSDAELSSVSAMAISQEMYDSVQIGDTIYFEWN